VVVRSGVRVRHDRIDQVTGGGYDGHTFWDMEMYVLPVLTYVAPEAARDALRWRHATMDLAEARARQLHLKGAAFPWRTVRGQECSGHWPASTAGFHINAAVAHAGRRYLFATGDLEFFTARSMPSGLRSSRPLRFHDLRHTYAAFLIHQGANAKQIMALMGHSTIRVTFRSARSSLRRARRSAHRWTR
jgi:hypothetical protein